MHSFGNNLEKPYTKKKTKHTPSCYSLFTNCSFDEIKYKLHCYRGEDCMKRFCKDLRDHAMKIINYEENGMIPLTDKENKCYEKQKVCYICKKEFSADENGKNEFKRYRKVRDHCHYTGKFREAAHNIFNLRYKTPKKIPVVFHNGFTYDYHFIINNLAKEFYGQLEFFGENAEKYITFSVPISKKLDNGKTITYKLKFIDSFRFMSTSLSSLVDNLSEKTHSDKCKNCKSELNYMSFKDNQLYFQCLDCKKNSKKDYKELVKRFANTYEFCNGDTNKFILVLRKGVYPYRHFVNQHPTSLQTSHILHLEHTTSPTSHIPNISISRTSHMLKIPHPQHPTS